MNQFKSFFSEKTNSNSDLFINFVFAFFPISLILGSLIVNLNLLLFCCLGIFYLKSKILRTKYDFSIKIIFLFFLIIFLSTSLNFAKSIYVDGFGNIINSSTACYSTNCFSPLTKLLKSILFFRFFLCLIIIYLLIKFNILNLKYFFLTAALITLLLSLDVIFQYIFGVDVMGFKSVGGYNSGFFGDELIAGGYIQRFAFFSIFFTILVFKDKNYVKFIYPIIVVCILGVGILFAGNRMPLILFIFGLFLIFLFNFKIKKILFLSFVALFTFFTFIILSNESYKSHLKNSYISFVGQANTMFNLPHTVLSKLIKLKKLPTNTGTISWKMTRSSEIDQTRRSKTSYYIAKHEGLHKRIYLGAIETWKGYKIFGGGIKSFREDCWKLQNQPEIYLGEDLMPDKKNLLCSNHPHNYYLEVLTETGIVGLVNVLIIALLLIAFIFKKLMFVKKFDVENFILLSAIISLILETLPLRSTGSLFTTNNATYLILIASIVISHKALIKTNNLR